MKERDIVDFSKLEKDNETEEYYDSNGNEIGCEICYTHEKAYEYFEDDDKLENNVNVPSPRCPICGNKLSRRYYMSSDNAVVSEVNYSNPDGEIGLYSIWECENEKCQDKYKNNQLYALMPIPIEYNANHDIYYTGGKDYLIDKESKELCSLIYEKLQSSIMQYVDRKLNPKNKFDKQILNKSHLSLWCNYDIEHAIAEYLYKHGMKK